ncbi:MAG: putative addiction module antidote protein [Spirochaetaceae bacterium]|nr:putative addiction module antidote protein [Spirochaetaceae bacterium]
MEDVINKEDFELEELCLTKEDFKLSKYDLADYINTKEDFLTGIEVAIEKNNMRYLIKILNAFSRSKNFSQIADELNLSRAGLYKSLSPQGNPSFETVMKLFNVLGIRLKVEKA